MTLNLDKNRIYSAEKNLYLAFQLLEMIYFDRKNDKNINLDEANKLINLLRKDFMHNRRILKQENKNASGLDEVYIKLTEEYRK